MKKFIKNEIGISVIEVLIGFAIMGVGSFLVLEGISYVTSKKNISDKNSNMENTLSGLVESIRTNISMEKIDFQSESFLDNTNYESVEKSLNLCWVNDGIIPKEAYPDCPGKIGYVISTLKTGPMELRGLYKVTIRLTHSELFPKTYKQYEFIVKDP